MKEGQIISFWADADEAKHIKKKSKEERRSVSNFIKYKIFQNEKG